MKKYVFWSLVCFAGFFLVCNILLIPSKGTIDARDWAPIFRDVATYRSQFLSECLSYHCPSNMILAKFPPGYFLLFYIFSLVFPIGLVGGDLSAKILIFAFYLMTGIFIVWFAKRVAFPAWVALATYLALPSLLLNAQGLAYTDIVNFPFFILSMGFLHTKKFFQAGIFYTLCVLVKWQPIIVAPIILLYVCLLSKRKPTVFAAVHFISGALCVFGIFMFINPNIVPASIHSLVNALGHHNTNALNIPWLIQTLPGGEMLLTADGWPVRWILWAQFGMFVTGYFISMIGLVRMSYVSLTLKTLLIAMLCAYTSYYVLSFGVHENHFMLATIMGLLLYLHAPTKKSLIVFTAVEVINTINMFFFYGIVGSHFVPQSIGFIDISVFLSIIISSACLWFIYKAYTGSLMTT